MQLLHNNAGGATNVAQNLMLMTKIIEKEMETKIETCSSMTISGSLEARVGGKNIKLGTSSNTTDKI